MNKTDHAIVVGISCYPAPEYGNLGSPENDARAFYDWLVSTDGGAVPRKNIELILSSDFVPRNITPGNPPFHSPIDALPTIAEIQRAFDRLHFMSNEKAAKGEPRYIGRRLYIYLSGHGFAPSDPSQAQEAVLYAANAMRGTPGYSIPGRYNADWFFQAFCFDEILLFMDCCRGLDWESVINKPYKWEKHPDALNRVKYLYGFAAKWSKNTRERKINGVDRGVFTTALLEGLKVATAGPDAKITTNSLCNYLKVHMKEFMAPEDKDNANVSDEPYVTTYPESGEGFLIVELTKKPKNFVEYVTQFVRGARPEVPKFPVVLRIPAVLSGKPIRVLDHELKPVPLDGSLKAQPEVKLELERGMYQMQIEGSTTARLVEVSGVGGVLDVNF